MLKFNKGTVSIEFEFVGYDSKLMNVNVQHINTIYYVVPNDKFIGTTTINVELPTTLILNFSGKDYMNDTVVDTDGKIVKDVYVRITSMSISGFKLSDNFLYQKLTIVTDDNRSFTTPYIGFNGTMDIDLNQDTIFRQYLTCANTL